jgi:hypothetical protein
VVKVRLSAKPDTVGSSARFNVAGLFEFVVAFADGDMDTVEGHDLDIQLADGTWLPVTRAFRERFVIPDNYNTFFREPVNGLEQQRGWF